jgi:hypothetical protein
MKINLVSPLFIDGAKSKETDDGVAAIRRRLAPDSSDRS